MENQMNNTDEFPEYLVIAENSKLSNLTTKVLLWIKSYMRKEKIDGYIVIYGNHYYKDIFDKKFDVIWDKLPKGVIKSDLYWPGKFIIRDKYKRETEIRVVLTPIKRWNQIVIFKNPRV